MNNFSDNIKKSIAAAGKRAEMAREDAEFIAIGKRVRIVRDWHDQPIGKSRTNQKGKEFIVKGVGFDLFFGHHLLIGNFDCPININCVEFLK